MTPEAVNASVIIYGFGFDKIYTKQVERLKSPVLGITDDEDTGAMQAAINFLSTMKEAKRLCEIFNLPGRGPRLRATTLQRRKELQPRSRPYHMVLVEDFIASHSRP
jgi:hypothetical protein